MRAAAALLSSARSPAQLAAVVQGAHLCSEPIAADDASIHALGIRDVAANCQLAAGPGLVRVIVLSLTADRPFRENVQHVARRLASSAPHVLWVVAACDARSDLAAIAAWHGTSGSPRIACFVWEPSRVVDSDAETLCALSGISAGQEGLLHTRCIEVLGRESLTRRFYRALEAQIDAMGHSLPTSVSRDDARETSLIYVSRLLFLCFLEAKGWLDGDRDFLSSRFDECMQSGGGFHRRALLPLFFGTLNTPWSRRARSARAFGRVPFLNGGLFARTAVERRLSRSYFPDERFGSLLDVVFRRYRFVASEDSALWSEASVDPEMLGRAFESLMGASERKAGGTFYTPHQLVERVTNHALSASRLDVAELSRLRTIRVLDPACGSGAFLVHALERLASLRAEHGDIASLSDIRRDVLARSVFGVDRNPTAVWLCELRLWLSVVIESVVDDPMRVPPLPNLDRNIRVGDALAGAAFDGGDSPVIGSSAVARLRQRYVRATGVRKRNLARTLDRAERARVVAQLDREIESGRYARRELLGALRARNLFGERVARSTDARRELTRLRELVRLLRLERRRITDGGALPFSFPAFFGDAHANGGFDVVLGNPPWVRLHRIPRALRAQLREHYEVFRGAAWMAGAESGGTSVGFASQVDVAALFVERAIGLLRPGGVSSLLLPAKLFRSLAGGGLRAFVRRRTTVVAIEDLSESPHAFEAAVYPALLVARSGVTSDATVAVAVHDRREAREWRLDWGAIELDASPGAPWLIMGPQHRAAFDRLQAQGQSLSQRFGAPRLGVKSGCNAAFVVRVSDVRRGLATIVDADGETGSVEAELLRPALRGESVARWTRPTASEVIIWTHDATGAPMARLPDRARTWFKRRYNDLAGRSDAARSKRWWSLFRIDAAHSRSSRVVWSDFGRRPRALVLEAGDATVPLNSCYVVRCPDDCDAWALAALLNSPVASSWLNAIAEPARGGYRRYLGWTVGLLPLPRDWARARGILANAGRGASTSDDGESNLLDAVLAAYGIEHSDVAALMQP